MVWYGAPDSGTARDLRPVSLTGVCACGLCYDHLAPNRRRGGDNRELGRRGGPGDGRTGHDAVHCRLCDFVSCVLCVVVEASYVLCLTFFGKRRPTRAAFFRLLVIRPYAMGTWCLLEPRSMWVLRYIVSCGRTEVHVPTPIDPSKRQRDVGFFSPALAQTALVVTQGPMLLDRKLNRAAYISNLTCPQVIGSLTSTWLL